MTRPYGPPRVILPQLLKMSCGRKLAYGERAPAHVHVDHLARPGLQRHHREGTGVGEQVQYLDAMALGAARADVAAHPAAALGHVEKQAVVLPPADVHAVARALLGDDVRLGHAAGHGARLGARGVAAALKDPVQRGAGRDLLPAAGERGTHGGELGLGVRPDGQEAGEHENGREGVERPVLATGVQAAPAMEDALGVGGQIHRGDGFEQGVHGQIVGAPATVAPYRPHRPFGKGIACSPFSEPSSSASSSA
jgi:hypothetical protein